MKNRWIGLTCFSLIAAACGTSTDDNRSSGGPKGGVSNAGAGGAVAGGGNTSAAGTPGVGGATTPKGGATGTGGAGAAGGVGVGGTPAGGAGAGAGGTPGGGAGGTPGGGAGGTPGGGAGGTPGGGTAGANTGAAPPGYWTSKDLHGCIWTGIDTVAGTTTTITPKDFTAVTSSPYCVSGSVFGSYDSVSLLGFNLAEPAAGTSCAYKPVDMTTAGPPEVAVTGTGIALNFSKKTASTLRIQIQGKNGATDENNRWCYTITDPAGPIFAKFSDFYTKCWFVGNATESPGNKYNNEPLSAVVFSVPGTKGAVTDYNYCIDGFAFGSSVADAPTGSGGGDLTGKIGGPGGKDLDFQRVKVKAGGKSYIIQNNNWGKPDSSDQTIEYKNNSFTITSSNGSKGSGGEPASFPSIYIGANGSTQNGLYSTRSDDNLPKKVSEIQSINTTMKYNRASGDYNASYDVWFAASTPTGEYTDGISGFIMVWLYQSTNNRPIGNVLRQKVTIPGVSGTWDVWGGPRSNDRSNVPVISYVATSPVTSLTFDLNKFIQDAVTTGAGNYKINSSWLLTDVFGGFEIWDTSQVSGLSMQEFTAVVQ